jgi:hypothetical protein
MVAPTTNLDRTLTVTLANPTPPTNVVVNYQGTPPTPTGLAAAQAPAPDTTNPWTTADPLNGAVAGQLAGLAEAEGTEVHDTVTTGRVTTHGVDGTYTESPNTSHPSGTNLGGPEHVVGGNFAAATGWTLSGGATIGTGTLNMDGTGAGQAISTSAVTIVAGDYLYEFDVVSHAGTTPVTVGIGGTTAVVAGSNVPGHFTGTITTAAASQIVGLFISSKVCKLDNFSVRRKL